MFIKQICSLDGNFLRSWTNVKETYKNKECLKGSQPSWFTNLEQNIIYTPNRRLHDPISPHGHINKIYFDRNVLLPNTKHPRKEWSLHWNNISLKPIYGKSIKHNIIDPRGINTVFIEHFIPYISQNDTLNSPRSRT